MPSTRGTGGVFRDALEPYMDTSNFVKRDLRLNRKNCFRIFGLFMRSTFSSLALMRTAPLKPNRPCDVVASWLVTAFSEAGSTCYPITFTTRFLGGYSFDGC